jgi:hypothetical protein
MLLLATKAHDKTGSELEILSALDDAALAALLYFQWAANQKQYIRDPDSFDLTVPREERLLGALRDMSMMGTVWANILDRLLIPLLAPGQFYANPVALARLQHTAGFLVSLKQHPTFANLPKPLRMSTANAIRLISIFAQPYEHKFDGDPKVFIQIKAMERLGWQQALHFFSALLCEGGSVFTLNNTLAVLKIHRMLCTNPDCPADQSLVERICNQFSELIRTAIEQHVDKPLLDHLKLAYSDLPKVLHDRNGYNEWWFKHYHQLMLTELQIAVTYIDA